jgi:hypothetical protein
LALQNCIFGFSDYTTAFKKRPNERKVD